MPPRDQLPRSLPAHAHQPDVRAVESGHAEPGPAEVADRASGRRAIARTTRPTTTRTPTRSRPSCATPTRRWWWCRGSALFGFAKDKREARITTEFFVNAIHVMAGANALEGGSAPHRAGAPGQGAGADEALLQLPQLRGAAAAGSVSHRVLGARGGQAAADAAGAGVQPEDRAGDWRRERHRARRRAAAGPTRGARRGGRFESGCRPGRGGRGRQGRLRRDGAGGRRESGQPWQHPRRGEGLRPRVRRPGYRGQHRRHLSHACSRHANGGRVEPGAGDQRQQQPRAGAGGERDLRGAAAARQHRADQLGERRRAEARQRALRRQQGRDQPPDSRAGDRAGSGRARQRHRPGHRRGRLGDVPARPGDRVARRSTRSTTATTSPPTNCGRSWPCSTRSGPSRGVRFFPPTAPTRSAGWPATRAPGPPAT